MFTESPIWSAATEGRRFHPAETFPPGRDSYSQNLQLTTIREMTKRCSRAPHSKDVSADSIERRCGHLIR